MFVILQLLMAFIIVGLFIYWVIRLEREYKEAFIKNSVETDGVVEGRDLSAIRPSFYHLEYSYPDKNGMQHKGSELIGSVVFKYKKGDKIIVCYDPNNPKRSVIKLKQEEKQ